MVLAMGGLYSSPKHLIRAGKLYVDLIYRPSTYSSCHAALSIVPSAHNRLSWSLSSSCRFWLLYVPLVLFGCTGFLLGIPEAEAQAGCKTLLRQSFYALHSPSTLISSAKWPTVRMHRTHRKAYVSFGCGRAVADDVKVGTNHEVPCIGRISRIERIQPVVASRQENAVAIASLETDTFHAV